MYYSVYSYALFDRSNLLWIPQRSLSNLIWFWKQVRRVPSPYGCWEWQSQVGKAGYGLTPFGQAHQLAFYLTTGEWHKARSGKCFHHICENKVCVCPYHLEVVTYAEHRRKHALLDLERRFW